jgi:2-C-methyl-D-erythritol 4-phosphate cytidylyltransferase
MPRFAVILPAAGGSTRFGGPTNKLLADLGGEPVLARTLRAFLDRADVEQVVIPTGFTPDSLRAAAPSLEKCLSDARVQLCPGGPSRAESVRAALARVAVHIEWVAVHDAARPLVSATLIDRVLAAAEHHGAAVPAQPMSLTVKEAVGPLPAPVRRTVARGMLWSMQTPQVMRRAALIDAFARCPLPLDQVTDDAQLLELTGQPVWLTEGEERNLKITTALDLRVAALLLSDPPA